MKWFKKLFQGKCGKEFEIASSSAKLEAWSDRKLEAVSDVAVADEVAADEIVAEDESASSIAKVAPEIPSKVGKEEEMYALTTLKNFRGDTLKRYEFESEWVLLNREQVVEPKFQKYLERSDKLTAFCKKIREGNYRRKESVITAVTPHCHCLELSVERSVKEQPRHGVFRRFVQNIKRIWKNFCYKIKSFKVHSRKKNVKNTPTRPVLPDTKAYLSAGRVRALRGGRTSRGAGAALRAYALHLAQDKSTTFAQNIDNFISCTLDSKETSPQVMMRNMRQFMSGMKNYLVKHGEREFEKEVEKERLKLKPTEFLNLDAILEGVMHRLVVRPLRSKLYTQLAAWYSADVRRLHAAIERAQHATPLQLGIKESTKVPSSAVLAVISRHFLKMQEADSPLDKLENLLAAISVMFNAIRGECAVGADDLLPVLAWTVARCRLVCAELEAELMAGLLPAALLAGEGGYYLTALFSAVAVLKRLAPETGPDSTAPWRRGSLESGGGGCAVVRVALPDECRGSIRRVALPCRPGARARDLCRALAHAAAITNPQDYALFALHDGQETMLNENDCPQEVMSEKNGHNFILAYKRIDAKIAWPQQALSSYP